jgi:tRNA U38,U39,U40 pseudouridine synthase TruA
MPSPIRDHAFWADAPTDDAGDVARKRAWRIQPTQVEQLRATAQKYVATHNFHNFTVNGVFSDRSNQRFMKNLEVRICSLFRSCPRSSHFSPRDCRSCGIRRDGMD